MLSSTQLLPFENVLVATSVADADPGRVSVGVPGVPVALLVS